MPPNSTDPTTPEHVVEPTPGEVIGAGPQSQATPAEPRTSPRITPQGSAPPGQPSMPAASQPAATPQSPNHGSKKIGLIVVIVVLIAALAGAVVWVTSKHKNTNGSGSGSSNSSSSQAAETSAVVKLAQKGAGITAADLQSINGTDLFYGVFAKAAEQTGVTTTRRFYQTKNLNDPPVPQRVAVTQAGFNYETKEFTYQDSTAYSETGDTEFDRCVKGVSYFYSSLFSEEGWKASTGPAANDSCSAANNSSLNDGVNTGGLTAAQAAKFVDALRGYKGLVSVDKVSVISQQGKPYVRFDVTIHILQAGSISGGNLYLSKAFDATGLDASSWPYTTSGAIDSGIEMAYIVDPTTQLPAYSQIADTPPNPTSMWGTTQVEYTFGTALPQPSITDMSPKPMSISWPVQTLQQYK